MSEDITILCPICLSPTCESQYHAALDALAASLNYPIANAPTLTPAKDTLASMAQHETRALILATLQQYVALCPELTEDSQDRLVAIEALEDVLRLARRLQCVTDASARTFHLRAIGCALDDAVLSWYAIPAWAERETRINMLCRPVCDALLRVIHAVAALAPHDALRAYLGRGVR